MSLQTAIARVQTLMAALSGIKVAPALLPDNVNDYPFIIAYDGEANWDMPTFDATAQHEGTIVIELHAGSRDKGVRQAIEKALPFAESVPKALLGDPRLNDTVSWLQYGSSPITSSGLIIMEYGGIETYGYRWRLGFSKEEAL